MMLANVFGVFSNVDDTVSVMIVGGPDSRSGDH